MPRARHSPNPSAATFTFLRGVACTSGRNCWAAGEWGSPTGPRTLIEHRTGSGWAKTGLIGGGQAAATFRRRGGLSPTAGRLFGADPPFFGAFAL